MGFNPSAAPPHADPDEPAPAGPEDFAFASEAEADAYWAGVADGIRNAGGRHHPRLMARARDSYPELVATAEELGGLPPADVLDFDPVSTRHRIDGWTPAKQREFVEALADSGVVRYAAARVGMSEQSVARLRRRADARSFDLACEAAVRIGARRLRSIAFERAIEGTIKRHYYHGELRSEERVFDNRLLAYLLGKVDKVLDPPAQAAKVAENWQPWMDALEAGAEPPVLSEDERTVLSEDRSERLRGAEDEFDPEGDLESLADEDEDEGLTVWESEGRWWTAFPPPAGFDGQQDSEPGRCDYRRTLPSRRWSTPKSPKCARKTSPSRSPAATAGSASKAVRTSLDFSPLGKPNRPQLPTIPSRRKRTARRPSSPLHHDSVSVQKQT